MPIYNLIKNNQIINTIVADQDFLDHINDDIDSYEEIIPPLPVAAPELPITWNINDFRNNMTLTEKVKWDNNVDPVINTVKLELSSPKEKTEVTELTNLLVSANIISQATSTKILAAN